MKIAITADVHLKADNEKNKEKYNALNNIIKQMLDQKIDKLFIAGDLFDKGFTNYSDFEKFCNEYTKQNIEFHIIPGNHDPKLRQEDFTAKNIYIYNKPAIKNFTNSKYPLVLIPYSEDKDVGSELELLREKFEDNKWILVSHGDWLGGRFEQNILEPGSYMPITQTTIDNYKPSHVVLGHIHKPNNINDLVTYCGSPLGLDITETGKRRFLVIDTESSSIDSFEIDTDILYYTADLIILPCKDEEKYIKDQIADIIKNWNLTVEEENKAVIRINVSGYSNNKAFAKELIDAGFNGFWKYDNDIDISGLNIAEVDPDLIEISNKVIEYIRKNIPKKQDEPDIDLIILKALKTIYGV